jgi:HSP20 family molecular chaperone IbpA
MPKRIDDDDIRPRYRNGILDVYLPPFEDATTIGKSIPSET